MANPISGWRKRGGSILLLGVLQIFAARESFPQERFGETVEIKLIEVNVVVTRRDGSHVYGLTAADFDLYEGSAKQKITNFSEYRSAGHAVVSSDAANDKVSSNAAAVREPHTTLILIDALPRVGFVRRRVFEQLEALLPKTMTGDDRVALVVWTPGYERATSIVETSDPQTVTLALRKLYEKGYEDLVAHSIVQQAQLEADFFDTAQGIVDRKGGQDIATQDFTNYVAAQMDLLRIQRKVTGMKRLTTSLAARPGRKDILYVSNSFEMPLDPQDRLSALNEIQRLVRLCNASGITFYAVRPAVPDGIDQSMARNYGAVQHLQNQREKYDAGIDALRNLTIPTGGDVETGLRAVADLGTRMVEESESYYSLAYRAAADGKDRERRLSVRLKNRAYRVRMRQTFVDKSNVTLAGDTVVARLFSDTSGHDLAFSVEEGEVRRTGNGRWILAVVVKIPTAQLRYGDEGKDRVAHVRLLVVAGTGLAEVTPMHEDELRIVGGADDTSGYVTYSVDILGDGHGSKVAIGVYDEASGYVGVKTIDNRRRFGATAQ